MTFLDTGVLVGSVLAQHPEHIACRSALEQAQAPFTDAHALAETFATLTGFYKVPAQHAAGLTLGLRHSLSVEALLWSDYERIGIETKANTHTTALSALFVFTRPGSPLCPYEISSVLCESDR
jgi:predicted nucleic acid-binding protein